MNHPSIPRDHRLEGVPTREILEGLARLHELILVFDGTGRVVWLSEALDRLCGGQAPLLGVPWTELVPRVPDPRRSMRLGRMLCESGHLDSARLPVTRKDGSTVELELSAFHVWPAGESSGPSLLTVVILREVERLEREAREAAAGLDFHRGVLDAMPEAVVAFDRSSFVTYANRAAENLLGANGESLLGKPIALFLPHAAGFGKIASDLEPHGELDGREIEVRAPGDEQRWITLTTRVLRGEGGSIAGSVAFFRDVTESRLARARLERQNAELEGYVHSVSHDLRSPLVSLLGFSRLLRKDYEDLLDDTGRHFLDRIEQAGRTMEELIRDLLELTRIGRPGENRTMVDPKAVLQQLRAELKPRLDEQGIELHLPSNPPLLMCDRTRVYQLFSNLLGNALHHMGPCDAPRIVVDVAEETDRHRITVSDNGKGIPESEHDRIFEVFQTVGPKSDGQRSTGVGLAIVKRVAEAHDGNVWVESAPGRGATFHVTLPR